MRYETIVEVTPEGQHMLRLVIVHDDQVPYNQADESDKYTIIPSIEEEEESGVVTWKM